MIARVSAKDVDSTRCRRTQAHEKLDCGGFPGSVGTKQSHNFAAAKGETEIVESDNTIGESLGDVVE
jgi:hypothetical protein